MLKKKQIASVAVGSRFLSLSAFDPVLGSSYNNSTAISCENVDSLDFEMHGRSAI